jgi:uncharacterized membrane protein
MKDLIHQNWIFIITGFFLAILGILIQQTNSEPNNMLVCFENGNQLNRMSNIFYC